jgi:hypothetical protein
LGGPTQWFGPFSTQAVAHVQMIALNASDAGFCAVCF